MKHSWEEMAFIEGVNVEYNGKFSALEISGVRKEYRTGEMICELARLDIRSLKNLLLEAPGFKESPDRNKMREVVGWLWDEMRELYPAVISEMLCAEFLRCLSDYYCDESGEVMRDCINDLDYMYSCDDFIDKYQDFNLLEYAFKNTRYKKPGAKTVGQLLLTMYLEVNLAYVITMRTFSTVVNDEIPNSSEEKAVQIIKMTEKYAHLQEIDYGILFYNNRFNSVFTIKSMMALCLFELAHIYEKNVPIVRCKNCGHWFVPQKRSDTKYCNYPAPDSPEKTCKEIGAQLAWAKKEKTDDVTREYRRVYMRYKMTVNRHPDDKEAQKRLSQLTEGIKQWRKKLAAGEAVKEQFMSWLEEF